MKRRSFLKGLLAVPAVVATAKALPITPVAEKPVVEWGPQKLSPSTTLDRFANLPDQFHPIIHHHPRDDVAGWNSIVAELQNIKIQICHG